MEEDKVVLENEDIERHRGSLIDKVLRPAAKSLMGVKDHDRRVINIENIKLKEIRAYNNPERPIYEVNFYANGTPLSLIVKSYPTVPAVAGPGMQRVRDVDNLNKEADILRELERGYAPHFYGKFRISKGNRNHFLIFMKKYGTCLYQVVQAVNEYVIQNPDEADVIWSRLADLLSFSIDAYNLNCYLLSGNDGLMSEIRANSIEGRLNHDLKNLFTLLLGTNEEEVRRFLGYYYDYYSEPFRRLADFLSSQESKIMDHNPNKHALHTHEIFHDVEFSGLEEVIDWLHSVPNYNRFAIKSGSEYPGPLHLKEESGKEAFNRLVKWRNARLPIAIGDWYRVSKNTPYASVIQSLLCRPELSSMPRKYRRMIEARAASSRATVFGSYTVNLDTLLAFIRGEVSTLPCFEEKVSQYEPFASAYVRASNAGAFQWSIQHLAGLEKFLRGQYEQESSPPSEEEVRERAREIATGYIKNLDLPNDSRFNMLKALLKYLVDPDVQNNYGRIRTYDSRSVHLVDDELAS